MAKEQKKKEDEDLFNNLMEGDGKIGSNRMALVDDGTERSKRTGSHLSIHETSNFAEEPLNSPQFEGNNIFKDFKNDYRVQQQEISIESPIQRVNTETEKQSPASPAKETVDPKQKRIEELKQKQRETKHRMQERRSRSRPRREGSGSPKL